MNKIFVAIATLLIETWGLMLLIGVLAHSGLLPVTIGYDTSMLVMVLARLSGISTREPIS